MNKLAIQVHGLGKEYVIGGVEQAHDSFREMLTGALGAPFRKLRKLGGKAAEKEKFWALKDVSFEVEQGEVLGVIGPNGAGKSTLLKILSRITSPTAGKVIARGRVASLLEVGTGFHAELTGRENIYLNGAILGMSRREIDGCFEQIVEFSGVHRFLDTPVKRYSSGMYIRLAFSVAAHLRSETLLVDEVLAVGDLEFQAKCLNKLGELGEAGRTTLFVSHNLAMIRRLCTRVLVLDGGRLDFTGDAASSISRYQERCLATSDDAITATSGVLFAASDISDAKAHQLLSVSIESLENERMSAIHTWDCFQFVFEFASGQKVDRAAVSVFIYTLDGVPLMECSSFQNNDFLFALSSERCRLIWKVNRLPLAAGKYVLGVGLAERGTKWLCFDRIPLTVKASDVYGTGYPPKTSKQYIVPEYSWETRD